VIDLGGIMERAAYNLLTLYMLVILVYWFAPWLKINLYTRRTSWIPRLAEPLVLRVRRVLPDMGPMDFGPIGAVFVVWIARTLAVSIL
jgi:uncharacterized protein YggT (Ycf19 family)